MNQDQVLSLSYMPGRAREGVRALFALDDALASVLANGREPLIGRIRLAWWRETLETLDTAPAPEEPVLQQLARHVLPIVTGAELSHIEEGWDVLLSDALLSPDDLRTYAEARGGRLFRYAARLLGGESRALEAGGARWALVDLARHLSNAEEAKAALDVAASYDAEPDWAGRLRPLGLLAQAAARDLAAPGPPWEPHGAPGRMWTMLKHRVTGR